ncbi:hypothetical protein [Acuticoccus sp. I52.16.1]|uniref:hypothetical protein n=1 Tax=Acuticoccus sp. I52.16.1 TaxID=2928472 RepID=UPI001FD2760C|nr:hypothetical protein [Acuticoccus sp. I52.16.1]UOM34014.1 hypothetical protein MRB58_19595 [Acuticoccus sp. I52.16.1]
MAPRIRVDPSVRAKAVLAAEEWLQRGRTGWWRSRRTVPPALGPRAADAAAVIAPLVAGRSVALVGNASSLLAHPPAGIDDHDVVVRINRGAHVAERAGTIGARTDVVLVAGRRMAIGLAVDARTLRRPPAHMLFMGVRDRPRLPAWLVRRLSFYPAAWHGALEAELGASPSTGAAGIDLLTRLVGDGEVHLYGFDFWGTPTSYNLRTKIGPHAPNAEADFALRRVGAGRIHGWSPPPATG